MKPPASKIGNLSTFEKAQKSFSQVSPVIEALKGAHFTPANAGEQRIIGSDSNRYYQITLDLANGEQPQANTKLNLKTANKRDQFEHGQSENIIDLTLSELYHDNWYQQIAVLFPELTWPNSLEELREPTVVSSTDERLDSHNDVAVHVCAKPKDT